MKEKNKTIQVHHFLTEEERNRIFETICTNQKAFQHIGIPDSNTMETLHLSLESEKSEYLEQMTTIREAFECLSENIMKLLPSIFTNLGVEPFPVSSIPLSIINGFNSHKSDPHNDESGGRFKISFLYYLSKVPKAFRGGALEFYETDATSPNGHNSKVFAKIEHEDNLLIAFPSHIYHGVTDVQLDSTKFKDGRFVVVGFL